MHIRIIVKREKIEEYPYLVHKLTRLSSCITWINDSLIIVPSGNYNEITTILESHLICYGIESDVELPSFQSKNEKGKGA